ncbi:hypothetical protein ABZP36_005133 [Zizania latifolia]
MPQAEVQQLDEVQWTSCHAVPATEEESEIAVQFFSVPYPCQNGQLDREHNELGGAGARSSMHWQPDHGACYWPPLNGGGDSSGNGEGGYVDGCCYYLDEPDVSLGVNTLPCTSIDLNLLFGDNDGAGVRNAAPQPKRKNLAGHGGDLGRHKKKTRASDQIYRCNFVIRLTSRLADMQQQIMHRHDSSSFSDNESICSQVDRGTADHVAGGGNARAPAGRRSATIAQSLYARRRRERINVRLRILQKLVPNGTKVDISTMLEEAAHYVKFLQLQIKMLSSDELWMYAPFAYNGMDLGIDLNIAPTR